MVREEQLFDPESGIQINATKTELTSAIMEILTKRKAYPSQQIFGIASRIWDELRRKDLGNGSNGRCGTCGDDVRYCGGDVMSNCRNMTGC